MCVCVGLLPPTKIRTAGVCLFAPTRHLHVTSTTINQPSTTVKQSQTHPRHPCRSRHILFNQGPHTPDVRCAKPSPRALHLCRLIHPPQMPCRLHYNRHPRSRSRHHLVQPHIPHPRALKQPPADDVPSLQRNGFAAEPVPTPVCIVAIPTKREEIGRLRRRWPWRGVSSGRAFSSRRGRRSRWSGRSCLGRWASPQPLRSLITLSGAQCNDATSMILGAAFERRWSTRRRRSGRVVEEEWMATRRALPKIAECACCCRAVHYSRSGSAAAIGGGATVHARCGLLRHSRNAGITVAVALSVGTGSAAKPLKGWDVIGGWVLRALVCGR